MKRFHHEATVPSDRFDLPPADAQYAFAQAHSESDRTGWENPDSVRHPNCASTRPLDSELIVELTDEQAERRDELLDRGLPYTWRCSVEGQSRIMREHPGGRLEQMAIADDGALVVTRILKVPQRRHH